MFWNNFVHIYFACLLSDSYFHFNKSVLSGFFFQEVVSNLFLLPVTLVRFLNDLDLLLHRGTHVQLLFILYGS